jgi:DNA-binding CsgD family transcriptional regulator
VPSRVSSRTFVGRDEERRSLSVALDAAVGGHAGVTLINGEAGVGKTRLVGELRAMSGAAGLAWGLGGCAPLGAGHAPYAAVASALDDLWSGLDTATRDGIAATGGDDLVRLLPGLRAREDEPAVDVPTADLPPDLSRTGLFDAVARALDRATTDRGAVLVFEDLHWADAASLDLIGVLARSQRLPRVMLVATFRSDHVARDQPLRPWLAEIQRLPDVARIDLLPFDAAEVARQVAGIVDDVPTPELVASIARRSGGNAFYVEELLAADARDGADVLPPSLRDVLLERLDTLEPSTRRLVDAVAVSGGPVEPGLLSEVLDLDPDDLSRVIRSGVAAQVLTIGDRTTGDVDVRHALLREAVDGELLPGERRRWHAAFADGLARLGDPGPARRGAWWAARAVHGEAAGDLAGALVASDAAGRAAADAAAFGPALAHLERALVLWEAVPEAARLLGDDRAALLGRAARCADFAGYLARAEALFRAAVDALGSDVPAVRRAEALLDLATAWTDDDYTVALAASQEAYDLLKRGPPSSLRARAEGCLGRELGATQQWSAAREMAARSLATALAIGDRSAEAMARARLARCLAADGDASAAAAEVDRALAVQRAVMDRATFEMVYQVASRVFEGMGAWRRAAEVSDEARAAAEDLGLHGRTFDILSAWYHFQSGDRATTDEILSSHPRLALEVDNRFHRASALVDAHAGRREAALAHLEADRDVDWTTAWMVRAEVAVWTGRPGDAIRDAQAGLASAELPYDPENWRGWLLRTIARAEADIAEAARRRRRMLEAEAASIRAAAAHTALATFAAGPLTYRDRFGADLDASVRQAAAEAARARAHGGGGTWTTAADAWAAAADAWRGLERPADLAYARWREGEAWLRVEDGRDSARERLSEAVAIAQRLGARPIVDAVDGLARRARLRLTTGANQPEATTTTTPRIGADLTPRERDVLALLCEGATNRQIAEGLFITENTAGVHVSNILGKLDVRSRTEAVAVAHLAGLAGIAST